MKTLLIVLLSIIIAFVLSLGIYEFSNNDESCQIKQFNLVVCPILLAICLIFAVLFVSALVVMISIQIKDCYSIDDEIIRLQSVTF
jgi:hypothetical protein